MTVAGVGFSLALPAVTTAVVGGVAMQHIGKASGAFGTMRQLGGAFGVAIAVAVFAAAGSYGSAKAFSVRAGDRRRCRPGVRRRSRRLAAAARGAGPRSGACPGGISHVKSACGA